MIGERIKLARKKAGLSLRGLADAMGGHVTAQAIGKYERGEMVPSSDVLISLSKALGVSIAYLMSPEQVELGVVEFRTHSSTTAKERAKVESELLEWVEGYLQIETILELNSAQWTHPKGMPRELFAPEDAESLANDLREVWDLGIDPIPNMTELLEERGIKVLIAELPERVSGFTCIVHRSGQGEEIPVIVVNQRFSLERRRLTLAHELAHRLIAVSKCENRTLENWCNRFAGAFLVSKSHFEREIGSRRSAIGYREIMGIKRMYRISATALLMRMNQLGVLPDAVLSYAFRTMAAPWRKKEPDPLESGQNQGQLEMPRRFERLVYRALSEELISKTKAAELLRESVKKVEEELKGPMGNEDHCK
jgi:Zn-dependent peptidase ImmA (M78 family)/DNA-binding XRE family transcriptional regulator